MSPVIDLTNKVIVKSGGRYKNCVYKKTQEEKHIWKLVGNKTLKEISDGTGINITRIFRLKSYGGMLLIERDIFNEWILRTENNKLSGV